MKVKKDGYGLGGLESQNVDAKTEVNEDETYVGKPMGKPPKIGNKHETYIGKLTTTKTDMNKISNTRVGDEIRYFSNGVEDSGVVAKMNNSYITIFKQDGTFTDVHVNDTFFVKDILVNKSWDDMTPPERVEILQKVHAPSPRYLVKEWEQLPPELREAIQNTLKTDFEASGHGAIGGAPYAPISTGTPIKADDDYEGRSKERDAQEKVEFQHEEKKPKLDEGKGKETKKHAAYVNKTDDDVNKIRNPFKKREPKGIIYHRDGTSEEVFDDMDAVARGMKEHQKKVEADPNHRPFDQKKDKIKTEEPKMRGEFVYTEATKYRTKGVPETQANTWGMKQFTVKEDKKKPVTFEDQTRKHREWHESPREGRASSNHVPIGSPEFLEVDDDTSRCNMCGQEFSGRSKKKE
tara:strand:+ start:4007 stop:5227 length:1221 start_codon:yes stop_codon:yes gene_type:complete